LLLAITIGLFGSMANGQAQTQAPAKPAMPSLFLEDTVIKKSGEEMEQIIQATLKQLGR